MALGLHMIILILINLLGKFFFFLTETKARIFTEDSQRRIIFGPNSSLLTCLYHNNVVTYVQHKFYNLRVNHGIWMGDKHFLLLFHWWGIPLWCLETWESLPRTLGLVFLFSVWFCSVVWRLWTVELQGQTINAWQGLHSCPFNIFPGL